MNKKIFTGIAFLLMLFSQISCTTKVQENQSTVSVSGIGTVLAQPDIVQITIKFSHVASTTQEARKVVEQTMQQVLKILQEEKIEENYIKTISLAFFAASEYRNGSYVQIGQRAQQAILVTVNDIINNPERFSTLLDKITAINRVEISNIRFDIENKTELFKQSRELAYQKALDKAEQYASLSKHKVGKVLTISEASQDDILARVHMSNVVSEMVIGDVAGFSVPTGEHEVTTEINITFLLE